MSGCSLEKLYFPSKINSSWFITCCLLIKLTSTPKQVLVLNFNNQSLSFQYILIWCLYCSIYFDIFHKVLLSDFSNVFFNDSAIHLFLEHCILLQLIVANSSDYLIIVNVINEQYVWITVVKCILVLIFIANNCVVLHVFGQVAINIC